MDMTVKLIAYTLPNRPLLVRPAPVTRDWMDRTGERFAYRCLPLAIANAHGWEILCPTGFVAGWHGGDGLDAISFIPDEAGDCPAVSHFGNGIMTFHISGLFRTEPGYDLMVQGPINQLKDGIGALCGVVETDWAPFTFTMNWKFTRAGQMVRFEKEEPFCHVFPIKRGELEQIEPELRTLESNPELKAQFEEWTASRAKFIVDSKQHGSEAKKQKWQKHYYRGTNLAGDPASGGDHRTRVRLAAFVERAGEPASTVRPVERWNRGLMAASAAVAKIGPVKREEEKG